MPAGEEQAAALRALLTGKFDLYRTLARYLSDDEMRHYLYLVMAAFMTMADMAFGDRDDVTASVAGWVGRIRSWSEFSAEAFDPGLCEEVLLFTLDKSEGENLTGRQIRDTALRLLPALVHDQELSSAEIEQLLATSVKLANDIWG